MSVGGGLQSSSMIVLAVGLVYAPRLLHGGESHSRYIAVRPEPWFRRLFSELEGLRGITAPA
eukprot:8579059-Karenia_brevis.AAC.1